MKLGILESDDQIAAARYFATLPYVDGKRIGIWGWSYGGYNVLMSMSRGNGVFKAGVAIAAVSDWRFYDSVYTERFHANATTKSIGLRQWFSAQTCQTIAGESASDSRYSRR